MNRFPGEQLEISYFQATWNVIASFGWYLVGIAVFLWVASPYLGQKYAAWKRWKDERKYVAKYHKNPDLLQARLSAVEIARQKMQQEYDEKCALLTKEAESQSSGIATNGGCDRYSSKMKPKSIKGKFYPLVGDGYRGYRPQRRSRCGTSGCG